MIEEMQLQSKVRDGAELLAYLTKVKEDAGPMDNRFPQMSTALLMCAVGEISSTTFVKIAEIFGYDLVAVQSILHLRKINFINDDQYANIVNILMEYQKTTEYGPSIKA